ncbi:hypothetical protein [Caulobacter sp. LARHSG274]
MSSDPIVRLFGAFLMAVGGLMAALCGLCSLTFIMGAVVSGGGLEAMASTLVMALVLGGLPMGLGLLIFYAGRRLRAKKPPPPAAER